LHNTCHIYYHYIRIIFSFFNHHSFIDTSLFIFSELFKTSKGKYVAPAPIENILNNDTNIELSLVAGSGQVMTMAVVQIAEGLLPKITKGDEELKKKITADMTKLLSKVNSEIEAHEKVGFIVIANDPWTIEDGHLTPTMKIKRTQIEEKYESKLDDTIFRSND